MSDKTKKNIYLISTGLLSAMILMTIGNSIFNPQFGARFSGLGYPTYLIAPLMAVKTLGLIAIWTNKSSMLKEWAYAGFFFLFVIAMTAELRADNKDYFSPPFALILLLISYSLWKDLKAISLKEEGKN